MTIDKNKPKYVPALVLLYLLFLVVGAVFTVRPSLQDNFVMPILNVGLINIVLLGLFVIFVGYCLIQNIRINNNFLKYFNYFILFLSIMLLLTCEYFIYLESSNYPNFIYSHYSLDPSSLTVLTKYYFSLIIINFLLILYNKRRSLSVKTQKNLILLVRTSLRKIFNKANLMVLLILLLFAQVMRDATIVFINEIKAYTRYAENRIDLRRQIVDLPDLARRAEYIKKSTPTDSIIVHPPQSVEFPIEGNQPVLRYFIYPRELVTDEKLEEFQRENGDDNNTYILIVSEWESNRYYPYENYKATEILLLLENGEEIKLSDLEYTPSLMTNFNNIDIGIIKL